MIAVIFIPELPLVALCRQRPELAALELAIIEGSLESGSIAAVTARALAHGVRPGLRLVHARALCPALVLLPRDVTLERSALAALRDLAWSLSPRIELCPGEPLGAVALDLSGLDGLFGSPADIVRELGIRARKLGLTLRVGVARGKTLARIVAQWGDGGAVLAASPEAERTYVAQLPLAALAPSPTLAAALHRFGLRVVADLWRLPRAKLAARLGPEAALLCRRACGEEDDGGLAPISPPLDFREGCTLEWPLDNLEPLVFVLRGLIDRVLGRLALFGLVAGDMTLAFAFVEGGGAERVIKLSSPMRDGRALLDLCRVHLEKQPLAHAVTSVTLGAAAEKLREHQLALFAPSGPAPEKLAVTLARLRAVCGENRVGAPRPCDSYEQDAFEVVPFAAGRAAAPKAAASRTAIPKAAASAPASAPAPMPMPAPTTLRRLRPPLPLVVTCRAGRPTHLDSARFNGAVLRCAGPYRRVASEARELFDVVLHDGTALRICGVKARGEWVVEGVYD